MKSTVLLLSDCKKGTSVRTVNALELPQDQTPMKPPLKTFMSDTLLGKKRTNDTALPPNQLPERSHRLESLSMRKWPASIYHDDFPVP